MTNLPWWVSPPFWKKQSLDMDVDVNVTHDDASKGKVEVDVRV